MQDTLKAQLATYLGLTTGKKEWVNELANTLVKDDVFMEPLTKKGFTAGDVRIVSVTQPCRVEA